MGGLSQGCPCISSLLLVHQGVAGNFPRWNVDTMVMGRGHIRHRPQAATSPGLKPAEESGGGLERLPGAFSAEGSICKA